MHLQLVDVVEAAPSGAPKTTGVAGTCKHEIDILLHLSVHIWMQQMYRLTRFFYNALALNALPVHLLRQVFFEGPLSSFFRVSFLFAFWMVLEGPLGAHMVPWEVIWWSFGGHFGDFFRIRVILENVCFTFVKLCFLKFGRFFIRDFSYCVSCHYFWSIF